MIVSVLSTIQGSRLSGMSKERHKASFISEGGRCSSPETADHAYIDPSLRREKICLSSAENKID